MDERLAARIYQVEEPSTIRMAKLSRQLVKQGHDVINLSLGEPDFNTPDHIRKAACDAINEGFTHYPPVSGYAVLREAIAEKHRRDSGLTYDPAQIMVSTGAKQAVMNVILSILDAGDEIIIPTPFWVTYSEMVKLSGATSVFVTTTVEQEYKMSAKQLLEAITPKTRALLLCSPNNPTGSVYNQHELHAFAEILRNHPNIIVISDEIYEHINFLGKNISIAQFHGMQQRTVVVNGVSKAFAMTGWRIGWIAAPAWIVSACEKLQGQFTSGACSISQRAALAAMTGPMEPTYEMREEFLKRRNIVVEMMAEWPGTKFCVPQGAFYVFADVSEWFGKWGIRGAEDFCLYILRAGQVALVAGDGFGEPKCVRLSFAASEENLILAMSRVKDALERLG